MRALAVTIASCCLLSAQHRVPQQFAEISTALAAAQPGDVIWVTHRPAGYAPIVIDKAITILGIGGEQETPLINAGAGSAIEVRAGTNDVVTIGRIDAAASARATPTVNVRSGSVVFEDCRLHAYGDLADVVQVTHSDLVLLRTRAESHGGTALRALLSDVSALHARFFAGTNSALPAIELVSSTLHGSDVSAQGSEVFTQNRGGPALMAIDNSRVWLTHSDLRGGMGSPGAPALQNAAQAPAELANCLLTGGLHLPGLGNAPPSIGAVNLNASLLGAMQPPPPYRTFGSLHLGRDTGFSFRAPAGMPTLVLWSDRLVPAYSNPLLTQPIRIPSAAGVAGVGVGEFFALVLRVPNNPALLGLALWIHGVGGTTLPLQTAPVMGGVVRN